MKQTTVVSLNLHTQIEAAIAFNTALVLYFPGGSQVTVFCATVADANAMASAIMAEIRRRDEAAR